MVENFGTITNLLSLLFAHVEARHSIGTRGRHGYRRIFRQAPEENHRVKNNTAANYLMCFIRVPKFLHAKMSRRNYDAVESISDLRTLQNQLMREHAVLESTKEPEKRRLFWPQLQELARLLHQQFEDEIRDLQQKAHLHMNFTLFLLFAINPGPAKEFRTLRIAVDVPENEVDHFVRKLPNGESFIVFARHGTTRLVK